MKSNDQSFISSSISTSPTMSMESNLSNQQYVATPTTPTRTSRKRVTSNCENDDDDDDDEDWVLDTPKRRPPKSSHSEKKITFESSIINNSNVSNIYPPNLSPTSPVDSNYSEKKVKKKSPILSPSQENRKTNVCYKKETEKKKLHQQMQVNINFFYRLNFKINNY